MTSCGSCRLEAASSLTARCGRRHAHSRWVGVRVVLVLTSSCVGERGLACWLRRGGQRECVCFVCIALLCGVEAPVYTCTHTCVPACDGSIFLKNGSAQPFAHFVPTLPPPLWPPAHSISMFPTHSSHNRTSTRVGGTLTLLQCGRTSTASQQPLPQKRRQNRQQQQQQAARQQQQQQAEMTSKQNHCHRKSGKTMMHAQQQGLVERGVHHGLMLSDGNSGVL